MASLHIRYRDAILSEAADAVNTFRDLWASEPIPASEIVQTLVSDGGTDDSYKSDLYFYALHEKRSMEFLEMVFEVGFVSTTAIRNLAEHQSSKPSHFRFLLEKMDHEAIRNWRHHDSGQTLLASYMHAYVNPTEQLTQSTVLYMVETIGIPVDSTVTHELIRKCFVGAVRKAIELGVVFNTTPVDELIENSIWWRANGYAHFHDGDLDLMADMIRVLLDAGYSCLTANVRNLITNNGFDTECPALAALLAPAQAAA